MPTILGAAVLLPLISFVVIVLFGAAMRKAHVPTHYIATGAILGSFVLSFTAMCIWLSTHGIPEVHEHDAHGHGGHEEHAAGSHSAGADHLGESLAEGKLVEKGQDSQFIALTDDDHKEGGVGKDHASAAHGPDYVADDWYTISPPGIPKMSIGYHIDTLTIVMFVMVTFIASCIHFYAGGYMHEELHDVTDHEVTLSDGKHLRRPGRFHRFFQYLSLFCFSMLGLVIAGNVLMVFVFWELVGVCSYFLIGFYIERKSASTAANKAFIMNRVGDFGMLIGLAALWASFGTFSFGDVDGQPGLFSLIRPAENQHQMTTKDGLVQVGGASTEGESGDDTTDANASNPASFSYGLLIVAGLGIFCGCVGKSAQFPLQTWLPDAMEGPTPVSALVHSATMVAAGVYLVGRFYPVFTPEVLLIIAYVGGITLFMAATIAIVATDIKRVLAFSTVSQLGYMMLALGMGGWIAGLFHLITHAFFKSLLFMCSGSVIHACHTNEMPQMGGLRKKMPWTAYTMLVGCLAIAGAGIPFLIGFSGYYSKDAIIAQAISFTDANPSHKILFFVAAGGAAITAFYMFRLWFLTFSGKPRDQHVYDHAHESPKVMYVPLVVLAVLAVAVGWSIPWGTDADSGNHKELGVTALLETARPAGTADGAGTGVNFDVTYPAEAASHAEEIHVMATLVAFGTAMAGFLLAFVMYGLQRISAEDAAKQFAPVYGFFRNKWYFDELYHILFFKPTHFVSKLVAKFDRRAIDWVVNGTAKVARKVSDTGDAIIDKGLVDGLVNLTAGWIYSVANWFRNVQTGKLRQYVLFIVLGTVVLFVLIEYSSFLNAGH
ncbi:MAG: NADH-quinone oxidoreductase subunit L [Pirellulales bacterium]|nr:NADH-quinone oxidoreductase subunit L [Pirellulales bacterium]